MNRFVFRGKRKVDNRWIFGAYLTTVEKDTQKTDKVEIVVGVNYDKVYNDLPVYFSYEVDPATVGQCAGLKDKNGTWIFEGDIVKLTNANNEIFIGYIEYLFDRYIVSVGMAAFDLQDYVRTVNKHIEIIGNIHDNPQMLN